MARRGTQRTRLRPRTALAAIALGLVAGLAVAEIAVRVTDVDWRYAEKLLHYQGYRVECHTTVPDVELRYAPKPGSCGDENMTITINSFGFRDPERTETKPPGVFRILIVGGSNVFGADIDDDQAWPRRLEARLNESGGRFEVWNGGRCAYVPSQMVRLAELSVERFDVDLVVIALSNVGAINFLIDHPVRPYFDAEPALWRRVIPPAFLDHPVWLSADRKLWGIAHVRLYRYALLAWMESARDPVQHWEWNADAYHRRRIDEFLDFAKDRTRVCFFLCPGCRQSEAINRSFYAGTGAPAFELDAPPDFPDDYRAIHPPAAIMDFYADHLARWLRENGLVPSPE